MFEDNGADLFASLDSLADTVGGGTPLYACARKLVSRRRPRTTHRPALADLRRAVVMFSDGEDIDCGC